MDIRLTQFSHGAGCGCKISPKVLGEILKNNVAHPSANLLVGNSERDDAAAYLLGEDRSAGMRPVGAAQDVPLGDDQVLLATTDFFMPVVDDAFDFGRIAAANAISDIYAMGGRPIMALAILGWPINKLDAELASRVIAGARAIASECGITIAGGHSIDSEEPIFGLAVNGLVSAKNLQKNSTAENGDLLILTKPLGIGIHTTAMKKSTLKPEHANVAIKTMTQLNSIGRTLGETAGVHAMTDVTGFGLAGHLLEMISPQNFSAEIDFTALPLLPGLAGYIAEKTVPGGTQRNFQSFGERVQGIEDEFRRLVVCDPQTSGGLLVAVAPTAVETVRSVFKAAGMSEAMHIVGRITEQSSDPVIVIK